MNILIENQKLWTLNYQLFEASKKTHYIYIINGFGDEQQAFQVGKTNNLKYFSRRYTVRSDYVDINLVRLFQLKNISNIGLMDIEDEIRKFCIEQFTRPNFVISDLSEFFNGDADALSNFIESRYRNMINA